MKYYRAYAILRLELADIAVAKQLVQMAITHWQLQNPQFSDAIKVSWHNDPEEIIRAGAAKYQTSQFESSEVNVRDQFGTKLSFTWVNDRNTIHSFCAVSEQVEQAENAAKNFCGFCEQANAIYGILYPSSKKHGVLDLKLGAVTFLSMDLVNQLKLKSDDLLALSDTNCEKGRTGVLLRCKSGWNIPTDMEESRIAKSIKWPLNFPRKLQGVKSGGKTSTPKQRLGDYKDFIQNVESYASGLLNVPATNLRKEHLTAVLSKYAAADSESPTYPDIYRQIVAAFGTIICNETGGSWEIRGFLSKKLMISTDRNLIVSRYEVTELLNEFAGNEEMRVAFLSRATLTSK